VPFSYILVPATSAVEHIQRAIRRCKCQLQQTIVALQLHPPDDPADTTFRLGAHYQFLGATEHDGHSRSVKVRMLQYCVELVGVGRVVRHVEPGHIVADDLHPAKSEFNPFQIYYHFNHTPKMDVRIVQLYHNFQYYSILRFLYCVPTMPQDKSEERVAKYIY
jgi:hypothetical protein